MDRKQIIEFYDKESGHYSLKRYASIPSTYYQYLFSRRLSLFISYLKQIEKTLPENARLLEIGCADGVVMKAIEDALPGRFSRMVGVDISSGMIEQAKKANHNSRVYFMMRGELAEGEYDVVVELGVPLYELRAELGDAAVRLKPSGYYFLSVAGRKSLHTRFKLTQIVHIESLKTYKMYDEIVKYRFDILASSLYALFIPKMWAFPTVGRIFQPLCDFLFKKIIPELFHEKIYLLRNRELY